MNKILLVLSLVVCLYSSARGQKIVPTPDDLYTDAVEFMFSGDYRDALAVLVNLYDRGFTSPNINYLIGECYLNIQGQKTKAIPYLKDAVQHLSAGYTGKTIDEEYAPDKALLYLGIAYRLNNDFDNALAQFNKYLHATDGIENRRLAEYHIERCYFAQELMTSPAKFNADTLTGNINNAYSNFNPLVTADENILYYMNQLKFYDAVMQAVKLDSVWIEPENLTPRIKSDGDHYVTGMSIDGTLLYLTTYDPYQSGEIYATELQSETWSSMVKLNSHINTIFNETHASLSPDGNTLYFTSDRKGGYGGLDIYRSVKNESGDWDEPENLGPLINSPYNEETPFITTDGKKLFFSSQGHYNMGGYDIFCAARGDDGNWLSPVNIGYPLNTTDDDLFFFPLDTGGIAYQARFANSSAQTDIVRYTIFAFGKPVRFTVNGKINLKADPGYHPGEITVTFIDRNAEDTLATKPLNQDGSFSQKLPGGIYKLDFNDREQLLLTRDITIPDNFPHNNLVIQDEIIIPSVVSVSDTLLLKDILFAFDKSTIQAEYEACLEELLNALLKYPDMTVQINGHTDAIGSPAYNMKLSRVRANAVVTYLQKKADVSARITVQAFGESNPVASNTFADGTDNAKGRRYNRRVELIVLNAPESLVIQKPRDMPADFLMK